MLYVPALSVMLVGAVQAEIYEWRDGAGNRHFTNVIDQVPAEQRNNPKVLVREVIRSAADELALPSAAQAPGAELPREALVIYDRAGAAGDYSAGLRDGLALAEDRGQPVSVTINGPLAVANSESLASDAAYPVDDYYPFVTTSFDRGRSRHRTLRMLLQDQFQLDRDGPYVYERINPIGLGPHLQPFLARGLPNRIPPGHRVLFR
jgi:Domain of unknown function (DUF4124)